MFSGKEQIILCLVVSIYFMFLFALSLYMKRKTKTYEYYNVAGRSVSFFPLMFTLVGTCVGGATFLGYMVTCFTFGMREQWLHISMLFLIIRFTSVFIKNI